MNFDQYMKHLYDNRKQETRKEEQKKPKMERKNHRNTLSVPIMELVKKR